MRWFLAASLLLTITGSVPVTAQTVKSQPGAQASEFVTVTEPSAGAFTTEVAKGWEPNSGISTANMQQFPWIRATSPDKQSGFFVGDPNRMYFHEPGPLFPNGKVLNNAMGTLRVMPYQDASQFVATNGARMLPPDAQNVKLEGVASEPELAAKNTANLSAMGTTVSAATARYSFVQNGVNKIGVVTMQTARNPNGSWSESQATGFYSKPEDEKTVQGIYKHAWTSMKLDPSWARASVQQMQNIGMSILQQNAAAGNAMLQRQAQAANNNLNTMHQMGMERLQTTGEISRMRADAQADWHKNQMVNHYAQMAAKDNNNYHEVLMIQNKHLEYSPYLQRNVEVPNY